MKIVQQELEEYQKKNEGTGFWGHSSNMKKKQHYENP